MSTQIYCSPLPTRRRASPAAHVPVPDPVPAPVQATTPATPDASMELTSGVWFTVDKWDMDPQRWRNLEEAAIADVRHRYQRARHPDIPDPPDSPGTPRTPSRWVRTPLPTSSGRSGRSATRSETRSERSPSPVASRTRRHSPPSPRPNYYDLRSDLNRVERVLNRNVTLRLDHEDAAIKMIRRRYKAALASVTELHARFTQDRREHDRRRGYDVDGPPCNQLAYSPMNPQKSKRYRR